MQAKGGIRHSLWVLLLLPAIVCGDQTNPFEAAAPNTASIVAEFFHSELFTSSVRACFSPNATALIEEFEVAPAPISQCLLKEQPLAEAIETLGNDLAQKDAVKELKTLSEGTFTPQVMWDMDMEIALFRTWMSVFFGGSQFKLGSDNGKIQPRLWLTPSPIGRINTQSVNSTGPNIVLGQSCSSENTGGLGALQLDPELNENREASRKLLSSRPSIKPNRSDLIVSARVTDSGPTEVTGVGEIREQQQWENVAAKEVAEQTDQTSPGPPYPRSHMLMFYRADWFEALNVSIPDTWDELISLAEALPRLSGFQGSSRAAGPEDFPEWNLRAWPDVEFTPIEPVELLQGLPEDGMSPRERAETNSSLPRYALCLDLAPNCKGGWIFNAILASLSQTHGTWQGAFMDPISTDLLGETEPVLVSEAVRIYSRLTRSAAHQPSSAHSCALVNPLFASGACAMALDWDLAFPFVYNKPELAEAAPEKSSPYAQELVGKVGVAPLPGSTRVYNRSTASIVDCDQFACPLATQHTVVEYVVEGEEAGGAGFARGLQHQAGDELGTWEDAGVTVATSEVLVNRAPFSANTFGDTIFCNQRKDESGNTLLALNIPILDATSRVISDILLPMLNLEIFRGKVLQRGLQALGPDVLRLAYSLITKQDVTGLDGLFQVDPKLANPPPVPPGALESWWAPNTSEPVPGLSALVGMFLHPDDSARYFQALWKARYSYRNQAPDLWSTRTVNRAYRHAAEELSVYTVASPDFSLEAATQGFRKRCWDARASEPRSNETVKRATWYTTGFNEGMIDKPGDSSGDRDWVAGAIAGPVVAFVLALGISIGCCLFLFQNKGHKALLGRLKAPQAAAETTLLNTDIENSTRIWECLDDDVCDRALNLHNSIIRSVSAKYNAYECGTKGDAFLLAFHTVTDAVQFASEAQLQLMHAPWPEELLGLDMFRPVYVQPVTAVPSHVQMSKANSYGGSSIIGTPFTLRSPSPFEIKIDPCDDEDTVYGTPDALPSQGMSNTEFTTDPPSTSQVLDLHLNGNHQPAPTSAQQHHSGHRRLGALFSLLRAKASGRLRARTHAQQDSHLAEALHAQHTGVTPRRLSMGTSDSNYGARSGLQLRQTGLSGLLSLDTALVEATRNSSKAEDGSQHGYRHGLTTGDIAPVAGNDLPGISPRPSFSDYTEKQTPKPAGCSPTVSGCQLAWPTIADQQQRTAPTVGQRLQATLPRVEGPGEGRILVLRGLRVRMGMASGVERPEDVVLLPSSL